MIHRETFGASVLNHSDSNAVLHSVAKKKCLLTTPSHLSRGTLVILRHDELNGVVCSYRALSSRGKKTERDRPTRRKVSAQFAEPGIARPRALAKVVAFREADQLQNRISPKGGSGPCLHRLIVPCESCWVSSRRSPPLAVWL